MRAMIKPVLTVFALLLMIKSHVSGKRCHIPVLCNGGTTPAWVEVPEASEENPEMAAEGMKALKSRYCTELTDLTARIDALGKTITTLSQQVVVEDPTSTVTGTADHATPTDEPANTDRTKEIPSTSQRSESKSTTQVKPETTSIWEIFITKPQTTAAAGTHAATTATLADETVTEPTTSNDFCEFQYDRKCFWSEYSPTSYLSFASADRVCQSSGSRPANIYSAMHYELVVRNLQKKIPIGGGVYISTGLVIDPWTTAVTTTDGRSAPYQHWYSGYPGSVPGWTRVYIHTTKDANIFSMGMVNNLPSTNNLHGVICEAY